MSIRVRFPEEQVTGRCYQKPHQQDDHVPD